MRSCLRRSDLEPREPPFPPLVDTSGQKVKAGSFGRVEPPGLKLQGSTGFVFLGAARFRLSGGRSQGHIVEPSGKLYRADMLLSHAGHSSTESTGLCPISTRPPQQYRFMRHALTVQELCASLCNSRCMSYAVNCRAGQSWKTGLSRAGATMSVRHACGAQDCRTHDRGVVAVRIGHEPSGLDQRHLGLALDRAD